MSVPLPDDAPDKWVYKEHTRVKHAILRKYIDAWFKILGATHRRVLFVDGFAGRGVYEEEYEGSPLIAMRVGQERSGPRREIVCIFVEKNQNNFNNLREIVQREMTSCPSVKVEFQNDEFSCVVDEILDDLEEKGLRIAPAFFFIDPFGFSGVPMRSIGRVMAQERTEVFITFMVREINRFLSSGRARHSINELYGGTNLSDILDLPEGSGERATALLQRYMDQLKEFAGIRYVMPFNLMSEDRRETLYYLIHGSNHFKGFQLMKEVMVRQSELFSFLGPGEITRGHRQKVLESFSDDGFAEWLLDRFTGQRLTFLETKEQTFEESGPFIEKDYRRVLKSLESVDRLEIQRIESKRTGLKDRDIVIFPADKSRLGES